MAAKAFCLFLGFNGSAISGGKGDTVTMATGGAAR